MAAVGDARDPGTWSGIPYHLTQAGMAAGFLQEGLPLVETGRLFRWGRLVWNAFRVAGGDRRGGFQYSVPFLEALWRREKGRLAGHAVLNCFQLYPPSVVADASIEKWYFIDLTLTQVLDYYLARDLVGRRIAEDALRREREGYRAAKGIVVMSHFSAEALRRDYGVPASKVHVVVPGANLDPETYAAWERAESARRGAATSATTTGVRLLMVATDWERKGVDRLLRALQLARHRRAELPVTLKIIGVSAPEVPAELREIPGVTWLGRISKRKESPRFLREVSDADVGCIFSRYEAGGSVLREYHALGLAAFATNAGGMPDFMFEDATVVVDANAPDEALCEAILKLAGDRSLVETLREAAWRRHREALWSASVENLRRVIEAAG